MTRQLDVEHLRQALADLEPEARQHPERVRIVRAPGRVNLIGEHTDYNLGYVMPAAISLETWICAVESQDRRVALKRLDTGERGEFDADAPGPPREGWIDYIAGTAWSLREHGVPLRGMRGVIASTVPIGAGLSSSAALEVASAWALCAEVPPPVDGPTLARIAQRAENRYVGVNSGLMDQFASALGQPDAALLLDCRSLEYRAVPLPPELVLVACDTNSPRSLETSEYNERRAQVEAGVRTIARDDPSVESLRDVDLERLHAAAGQLDEVTLRRCEHVIRENDRVLAAEAALAAGDLETVGRLFADSHASLRDLYEVSSPELDTLVDIAGGVPGVVGSRMTGAGFGGCTVNLVRADAVELLRDAVMRQYPERTGLQPDVYVVSAVAGAGLVWRGEG